jgi:hypothetical protein
MHFAAANLCQANFDQVKSCMVVYILLLLFAFCSCCMHRAARLVSIFVLLACAILNCKVVCTFVRKLLLDEDM